jgi:hypothetical protein
MKINHIQRLQLQSWKRLQNSDNLTFKEFIKSQPQIWWVCMIVVISIWLISELTGFSDTILRAMNIGGILFFVMLYFRARIYWPISRQCINWERVDSLLDNKDA